MSEIDSDQKLPNADGVEEMESVEKGETPPPEFDKKLERKVLWKCDTRCVYLYFTLSY